MKPTVYCLGLAILTALVSLVGRGESAAPVADFGQASLVNWIQPDYPEAARKAKLQGEVSLEFIVGLEGKVVDPQIIDSTNELFNEAALAALRRWTFHPAVEGGKPVVSAMGVVVDFDLRQLRQKRAPIAPAPDRMPHGLKVTPAKFKDAPDPDYPEELEERNLPGRVMLELAVDETGHVREPRVLWASHAAFVEKALRAVEKTVFEPARQGPLPRATTVKYPVEFQVFGVNRAKVMAANHVEIIGTGAPDVLPLPFMTPEPVYPREKMLSAEGGSAVIECTLGQAGGVSEVDLVSASAPEFGAALVAAAETWAFEPAMKGDARVPVRLRVTHEFTPPMEGADYRLVSELRSGGTDLVGASTLDETPRPLWRGYPAYPRSLLRKGRPAGQAEIEFIIDRTGRARLPHIMSASAPEFGCAAAQTVSQWVFARPLSKGEPVDVKVSIPIAFTAPQE